MKSLYTLLYALTIILINPWGGSRGYIWTAPKVLVIWLIVGVNLSILYKERKALTISRTGKISLMLWGLFLSIGAISTLQSPFPWRSFWGQEQMGDGWLYWCAIAFFTLSNTLILRLHPQLLHSQFRGLLLGGIDLALSIFPQAVNWQIDYTATSGQLFSKGVLASTIFQGQQPIGLYSHRGHASIVLAMLGVVLLVGSQQKFLSQRFAAISSILILPALLLANTRMAVLGLGAALIYLVNLLGRRYYKLLMTAILVGALAIGCMTATRPLYWRQPSIGQVMSSRTWMWKMSVRGLAKRPLFGWGFDGFGMAYPYLKNPKVMPIVVGLGEFTYDYVTKKRQVRTREIPTYKAHNLILDTALSVGIFGLLSYTALWAFYWQEATKLPFRGLEAVAIAYLIFSLTWFECAQYAHIVWWALSVGETGDSLGQGNLS